ncbi:MAG: DNA polymerase Y family protein [Acidobacteria bacterium]|nr:DNA polymerase Y family protein [Acidobacteriota bacterium]
MFACLYLPLSPAESDRGVLSQIAYDFSPRVEALSDRLVLLDVSGLGRLLGDAQTIADELRRAAADKRVAAHVVVAGTRTAAVMVAHARAGVTVVPPGEEAATLAPLSLRLLEAAEVLIRPGIRDSGFGIRGSSSFESQIPNPQSRDSTTTAIVSLLKRWGLKTLGDLAALPRVALSERLGQDGPLWQRIARGEDVRPLVPVAPEAPFQASLDLEWPIDGLEPLSFVLGRLFEPLCRRLEEDDRAAIGFAVTLDLVTRDTHQRVLSLPAAVRDARVLRTLVLLDLESHPPPAAIDRVTIALEPTPGRIVQYSLLKRPLPQPEQISTMMARLTALMGENRSGSPTLLDTHRPGAFEMTPFAPVSGRCAVGSGQSERWAVGSGQNGRVATRPFSNEVLHTAHCPLPTALRRFRIPIPARVQVDDGRPARVMTGRRIVPGGVVRAAAGPWRSSGNWWNTSESPIPNAESRQCFRSWDREEWDVSLGDGAVYRIFFDRLWNGWFVEAVVD